MRVVLVAGFGPIVTDMAASRQFYETTIGLALEGDDDYRHSEAIDGDKHFALWRLEDAAESCFGTKVWPADLPVPTAWVEFDVVNMVEAVDELERAGHRLLVSDRTEPWGQVVTRLLSPEGLLVGLTITPWMRPELASPTDSRPEAGVTG
jgi:catechol 2,3-dioxygenase-like lactoylglutathione lyase family enzyme